MADGPGLALQAAVVARLKGDAGVSALVGVRVYDEPPQAVLLPYVRLGSVVVEPLRMDGHTDWTATFGIEVHSRPAAGRVESTRIAEAVVAALEGVTLTITGFTCDWCWFLTQTAGRDADGKSYVATVAFEASLGT